MLTSKILPFCNSIFKNFSKTSFKKITNTKTIIFSSIRQFSDAYLEKLENEANKNPDNPKLQAQLLKELNKQGKETDAKIRYESGKYSFDNEGKSEYLLSLFQMGKINRFNFQKVLDSQNFSGENSNYFPPIKVFSTPFSTCHFFIYSLASVDFFGFLFFFFFNSSKTFEGFFLIFFS